MITTVKKEMWSKIMHETFAFRKKTTVNNRIYRSVDKHIRTSRTPNYKTSPTHRNALVVEIIQCVH